ncbi:iron-containing redox enzyme family protein [Bdellovibrio sp. SKB1291214]|uniref:iron-containing redox enzyme family protein n=1 Tax=Bdellovibrio sp. SKB1291214 TaxID=1732569 RepID=UPI00223F59E8|nr:iron-containing redox enzyme family protein [Bdellovibrio sp. SKB1291214]UYL08201.1 iron-containing redox enzyme family protein [Bdellovibrio sp. SKB1291214]
MQSREFNQKATAKVDELCKVVNTLPWENVRFYNSWLAQTNDFVKHTSVFLLMCNERLAAEHPLKKQFEHHIEEESGHEKMSQNDLKFMHAEGVEIFQVTKAFWKAQYYWIRDVSAVSHLGYSLLLEGLAAKFGPILLKRVKEAGFKGCTFLKVHAEEDVDHFRDVLASVDKVTDKERDEIYANLIESMDLYIKIMNECAQVAHQKAA